MFAYLGLPFRPALRSAIFASLSVLKDAVSISGMDSLASFGIAIFGTPFLLFR